MILFILMKNDKAIDPEKLKIKAWKICAYYQYNTQNKGSKGVLSFFFLGKIDFIGENIIREKRNVILLQKAP